MVLSDCVCPGHELRLECTVVGAGTTVWRGSAFSGCNNNEIVLLHSRLETTSGECNNGAIVGHGIRQVGLNYTSQLIVHLNATLRGKSLECFHDDGTKLRSIGNYTITYPSPRGTIIKFSHIIFMYEIIEYDYRSLSSFWSSPGCG